MTVVVSTASAQEVRLLKYVISLSLWFFLSLALMESYAD